MKYRMVTILLASALTFSWVASTAHAEELDAVSEMEMMAEEEPEAWIFEENTWDDEEWTDEEAPVETPVEELAESEDLTEEMTGEVLSAAEEAAGVTESSDNHFEAEAGCSTELTLGIDEPSSYLWVDASADDDSMISYTWWSPDSGELGYDAWYEVTEGGDYRCTVSDGYGNEETIIFHVYAERDLGASVENPYEGDSSHSVVEIDPDSPTTLAIYTDASKCTWENVTKGKKLPFTSDCITIQATTPSVYTCKVSDGYNYQVLTFELVIDNQFSLSCSNGWGEEDNNHTDYVYPGDDIELSVVPSGYWSDKAEIRWLDENDRVLARNVESYTLKNIDRVRHIRILATDQYGNEADAEYTITIENNLQLWQEEYSVYTCKGEKVTLSVEPSGDDLSGCTYKWLDTDSIEVQGAAGKKASVPVCEDGTITCIVYDKFGNQASAEFNVYADEEHTWDEWVVTKKPTVFTQGSRYRICSICGKKQVCAIAKLKPVLSFNKTDFVVEKGKSTVVKTSFAAGDSIAKIVPTNPDVVKVSWSGKNITVTGKKRGSTTVAVKTKAGKVVKFRVTVPKTATKAVKASDIILKKGKSAKIWVQLIPANTDETNLIFKSSNTRVCTVSAGGIVKAVGKGRTTLAIRSGNVVNNLKV